MKRILTTLEKIEIGYLYTDRKNYQTLASIAEKYCITPYTVSKTLHEIIREAIIPKSLVYAIRDKAVSNVKYRQKSHYKTLNSYNDSINIYEKKLKIIFSQILKLKTLIDTDKFKLKNYDFYLSKENNFPPDSKEILRFRIQENTAKLNELEQRYNLLFE